MQGSWCTIGRAGVWCMEEMRGTVELLTAGQMASLNGVSKKALRLYEQKGLLVPYTVDPETGYRYYTHEQCPVLDTIQQMQAVGFSLAEMKDVLDRADVGLMRDLLERKTEELERQSYELEMAKHAVNRLVRSCNLYENPPVVDRIALERVRRRRIVRFPITPYPFEPRPTEQNPRLRRWEMALREIERQFIERGLPLVLFHNVGCIIGKETLASREFVTTGGFITDERGFCRDAEYWDEGYYLTVTIDKMFLPDGAHAEYYWLDRMLDVAEERGYVVTGDYYSDALVESPLFSYRGRDMMMRLYLPVDIRGCYPRGHALGEESDLTDL